jgi:hypothetical protein
MMMREDEPAGQIGARDLVVPPDGLAVRPAAPLAALSTRALRRLARRADRYQRRDADRFGALAERAGITTRQLRLLADAWAEAGPSGVRAIGPAPVVDADLMDRAEAVLEVWRRRHFPLDAIEVERWRNRITIWRRVPGDDRTGELDRHALMQLRRTDDGRWHLYRQAVQGEWWPVVVRGRHRPQSLSSCLDAVRIDALHQFWGAGGPPTDLCDGDGLPDLP